MRVLITAQQLQREVPGGIGTYVRGLFAGLGSGQVETTAWAARGPVADLGLDPAVKVRRSPLPPQLLTRGWDAGVPVPRHVADRVHATSLSVPNHRRGGPPISCFVHDLAWLRFPDAYPARGRRWHDAALGRVLERCDLLMVPSSQTADDLLQAGAPPAKVHVVSEGCDHLPVLPRADDGGTFLLSVSTLEPRKNLSRLVEAYRRARPSFSQPWPLRIVGPAGWGDSLGHLASVAGVELLGRVDDAHLSALLASARALAYVPLFEGFGLPALEAMRAGLPVVASTTVPSVAPGTAVTADPLDVDQIACALITVLEDDGRRAEVAAAAQRSAAGLTWKACARHHIDLWEQYR